MTWIGNNWQIIIGGIFGALFIFLIAIFWNVITKIINYLVNKLKERYSVNKKTL